MPPSRSAITSLPIEQRVADLMSRMTVEEKAGQLTQYFHFGSMFDDAPPPVEGAEPEPVLRSHQVPRGRGGRGCGGARGLSSVCA